jgi:hypothetical protein
VANRKGTKRGKRRGLVVGLGFAVLLSGVSLWILWRATRPPADAGVHLPVPLSPRGGDLPRESIDAAERARLDALLKERASSDDSGRDR